MKQTTAPKINNLKAHIVLTESGIYCLEEALRRVEKKCYNNYVVVKDKLTYIIFPKKGFVNITGIKTFSKLPQVVPEFCAFFDINASDVSNIIVDNVSASGNFLRRVNLANLQKKINGEGFKNRKFFSCHFDRNFFPGSFCKTQGFGTLTLFSSGKYVVVGSKCLEQVDRIFQEMSVVISTL